MKKAIIQVEPSESRDPPSLVEKTMFDVKKHIRDNGLRVGDVLPTETAMAERLGVSRTVAREALRGLDALRIVDVGSGRRARVAGPSAEALGAILDHIAFTRQVSVQQILDVRRTFELRTVSLAALHRTDDDARELLETVAAMMAALERDDADGVMERDIRFHEIIARASGNPLYSVLLGSFRSITEHTWPIGWRARATLENRVGNIKCHEKIATAILAQEPSRAEAAMSEHFDSTFMVLLRAGVG